MRIIGCLGFIVLAACGTAEDVARVDRGIEGSVIDEFTKDGLAGAKVRFVSDTLDEAETVTDGEGGFTLDVQVPEGVRFGTLEASREGYNDSKQVSVYFDGTAPRAELLLRPKN
ncbi:MAG TPA: hypothetical protein VJV78_47465 [Polyangiales bacterium]|nr:hypothetical protein [Polyangiales bacterium]